MNKKLILYVWPEETVRSRVDYKAFLGEDNVIRTKKEASGDR